jgi:hypothetical protein
LTTRKFKNSYEYQCHFNDLSDGLYDYEICGQDVQLFTIFSDKSGWVKVVDVLLNNNLHINSEWVDDVKISDEMINQLRTDHYEYTTRAEVDCFRPQQNEWLKYPYSMYIHKTMDRFSSVTYAYDIKNSDLVSMRLEDHPIKIKQFKNESVGFGDLNSGDTIFTYGAINKNGFYQSFSGSGNGRVYVR